MSRAVGLSESIRTALSGLEPLFILLTQLGDVWFLSVLALGAFWLGPRVPLGDWDRRRGLVLLAVALAAFAATGAFKATLALPRPPAPAVEAPVGGILGSLYEAAASADGYGVPSGHATGAAAVYGTAALLLTVGRRRTRLVGAGLLVAVVSLSRVVLGLHYVGDVVVGAVLGLALAGLASILVDRPRGLLELAILLSLAWIGVVGFEPEPLALGGFAAGIWLGWWRYGESVAATAPTDREAGLTMVLGIALLGPTLGYAATAVSGINAAVVAAVGGIGVVALPLALGGEKEGE